MAISRNVTVTINGTKATVDSKIHVYSNDRGIDLHINLVNFDYVIRSLNQDVLKASARVLKPNRKEYFDIDTLRVEDKTIIFTITQAMTDEFDEIGRYSVQIHLFDLEGNRITIPPIDFYVNELVARDSIPIDSYAMADISEVDLYKAAPSDYVPVEGQYIRTWWYTGDYITSAKLNNLENGVSMNILQEDFTVQGVSIGEATDKKTYKAGLTALDIVKDMLTKRVVPSYTPPTMSMTSSVTSCELGERISTSIRINFNVGDSGGIDTVSISLDDKILAESTYTSLDGLVMDRDMEFIGKLSYLEGDIKYDNLGDEVPNHILAGNFTSSILIKAYHPGFAYCEDSNTIPNSDEIRNHSKYILNPRKGTTMKVVTTESTNLVVFAYPSSVGECSKIRYEELNDDNSKSIFTLTTLDVVDLQGTNPETYFVYYYIPLVPFGSKATFTMTI